MVVRWNVDCHLIVHDDDSSGYNRETPRMHCVWTK